MTALINTDGRGNYYYNYVNASSGGEQRGWINGTVRAVPADLLSAKFPSGSGSNWFGGNTPTAGISLRFPVPWETRTATVTAVNTSNLGFRIMWQQNFTSNLFFHASNTVGTSAQAVSIPPGSAVSSAATERSYWYLNDYCLMVASFSTESRMTLTGFRYMGWTRRPNFINANYPRSLVCIRVTGSGLEAFRVGQENTNNLGSLYTGLDIINTPALSCEIATTGANFTQVLLRDSNPPYNYIGIPYGLKQGPLVTSVGQIVKNVGIDPEVVGGVQHPNVSYICLFRWGLGNLFMPIWTEGLI